MNNPKYLINISYIPTRVYGQTLSYISGVTYSMPTYTSDFYVATMPEILISATGSSYADALTNLLTKAGTTPDNGQPPLSNTKTW